MKLMALSAGGYGTKLQALYIQRFLIPEAKFILIDDFISPIDLLQMYSGVIEDYNIGEYDHEFDLLVPSYNFSRLQSIPSIGTDYSINLSSKKNLYKIFNTNHVIPTFFIPDKFRSVKLVKKPAEGAGSRGIEIIEPESNNPALEDCVYQEFCDGFELIADCLKIGNKVWFTLRKSIQRDLGRDIMISMTVTRTEVDRVEEVLRGMVYDDYEGCFNIQFRLYNGKPCVQEFDARLTGSAIINTAYDTLFDIYKNRLKYPRLGTSKSISKTEYIKPTFNERAIESIYSALSLKGVQLV
jgi:hypothetical protein